MGIFSLFSRPSHSRKLERFLTLVYDYGPNVLDDDVFSAYPNILTSHSLSEVSNLARVAVLDASMHLNLPFYCENLFEEFHSLSNNPFNIMQDRFSLYLNSIRDFEKASYPNRRLLIYSRRMHTPYEHIYVMCIDSSWLFTRLVPNFRIVPKDTFITSVTRNILHFCNTFVDLLQSD